METTNTNIKLVKEEVERIRIISKLYDNISNDENEDEDKLRTNKVKMKVAKEQILQSTKNISKYLQALEDR